LRVECDALHKLGLTNCDLIKRTGRSECLCHWKA
jgi:hypothetical protein